MGCRLRTLEFQLGELFTNLRRNGILTVAAVMTVMSSLAILGVFYLIGRNFDELLADQARKAQISAFLSPDLSEAKLAELRQQIASLDGVERVDYVSPQAALERMKSTLELKPEELELLGEESRLPAKFAIQPADPAVIEPLAAQLEGLPGVEEVRYGQKVVAPLNELKGKFERFGWAAFLVLSLATCGIIDNAIRLTIYARRREIRIMQLVGATDGFIRAPFLLEGMVHGVVGGLLALAVTTLGYNQLREASAVFQWLKLVSLQDLMPGYALGLVVLGLGFGLGSSQLSIRRFLRDV